MFGEPHGHENDAMPQVVPANWQGSDFGENLTDVADCEKKSEGIAEPSQLQQLQPLRGYPGSISDMLTTPDMPTVMAAGMDDSASFQAQQQPGQEIDIMPATTTMSLDGPTVSVPEGEAYDPLNNSWTNDNDMSTNMNIDDHIDYNAITIVPVTAALDTMENSQINNDDESIQPTIMPAVARTNAKKKTAAVGGDAISEAAWTQAQADFRLPIPDMAGATTAPVSKAKPKPKPKPKAKSKAKAKTKLPATTPLDKIPATTPLDKNFAMLQSQWLNAVQGTPGMPPLLPGLGHHAGGEKAWSNSMLLNPMYKNPWALGNSSMLSMPSMPGVPGMPPPSSALSSMYFPTDVPPPPSKLQEDATQGDMSSEEPPEMKRRRCMRCVTCFDNIQQQRLHKNCERTFGCVEKGMNHPILFLLFAC